MFLRPIEHDVSVILVRKGEGHIFKPLLRCRTAVMPTFLTSMPVLCSVPSVQHQVTIFLL